MTKTPVPMRFGPAALPTLLISRTSPSRRCRRTALIDFTYNLGEEALAGSTLARLFNAGQAQAGCEQLSRWVKARVQGELVTLRGLVDRRGAELEVCLGQLQEVANAR